MRRNRRSQTDRAGGRAGRLGLLLAGTLLLFLINPSPSGADVYKYVDRDNVTYLTNVPSGPHFQLLIREEPVHFLPVSIGPLEELIFQSASRHGVDGALVKAVIKAESNSTTCGPKRVPGAHAAHAANRSHPGGQRHFSPRGNIMAASATSPTDPPLRWRPAPCPGGSMRRGAVYRYRGIPPFAETGRTCARSWTSTRAIAVVSQLRPFRSVRPSRNNPAVFPPSHPPLPLGLHPFPDRQVRVLPAPIKSCPDSKRAWIMQQS